MSNILLTPLRRMPTPNGDVLHGIKMTDAGFCGFGEAYFSIILGGSTKGWKRHRDVTLNLICVAGAVQFVVHDGGFRTPTANVILSPNAPDQYRRLTVPPMFWVAFRGLNPGENIILNVASNVHDPHESDHADLTVFPWPEVSPNL